MRENEPLLECAGCREATRHVFVEESERVEMRYEIGLRAEPRDGTIRVMIWACLRCGTKRGWGN